MKSVTLQLLFVPVIVALGLQACAPGTTAVSAQTSAPAARVLSNPDIILATTTSTQDSGLLDVLVPLFQQATGYNLKVVAVGTGQALQMGQEGNADVLLVHAPSSETAYMEGGFGKERYLVMHNDFIIVGPQADPAAIKGDTDAMDAFTKIADSASTFISRGDKSGTNTKELALWKSAGIDVSTKPSWYLESGQGMGATLTIASEKAAYTLTDRATYLAMKANLQLALLLEKDPSLLNVYHVITVNPEKWPKINYEGGLAFARWLIEPATQDVIGKFGLEKYGQALFFPDADKTDADLGL
jgi:tungstate transport system substrate-binding protein